MEITSDIVKKIPEGTWGQVTYLDTRKQNGILCLNRSELFVTLGLCTDRRLTTNLRVHCLNENNEEMYKYPNSCALEDQNFKKGLFKEGTLGLLYETEDDRWIKKRQFLFYLKKEKFDQIGQIKNLYPFYSFH